ncbi:MAG: ATP-binding protein [Bacteroidetes bacterium]|nr:ATP-binding protein [Bacteroidota bacterium]
MKDSPFVYGTTVSSHAFTNREKDVQKLKSNLLNGINTTIISPRRWGKSSLVEKVIREINAKEKKHKTVVIDLFSVGSKEEFLEQFAKEVIKASSGKWQEWMLSGKEFFRQLIPKLSLGIDPNTDFSISFDWKELRKYSEEVLQLPETIARKKGIRMIICLDEFQNLASYPGYEEFEKQMRAVWQRQKLVTYCLYGSKRHMMTDIFNNPAKPFYRFGDILLLPKIEHAKWLRFITNGFKNTGKNIDEKTASWIPEIMKNHSWYVQQLAQYTWNLTHKSCSLKEAQAALQELLNANSPLYQKEVESISTSQLNLLKAVAKGETQLTSVAVMEHYRLGTPNNVTKSKASLINNDLIQENNGKYEFTDPAFEIWFRKQYFGEALG